MPFGEDLNVGVGNRTGDPGLKYSMPGDNVRQKFTGYQKDNETQLDFAEARMYENRFGRFTAVDPLLASGRSANPQTFNRYIYVGNSPLLLRDPTGMFGDYYDSKGKFIGSDGIDDKLVYFAEVVKRREGGLTDIRNWHKTNLDAVIRAQHKGVEYSGEREAIRRFAGGGTQALTDVWNGSWKGLFNVPSTVWNTATTVTFLPFTSVSLDEDGLPKFFIPNPMLAQGYRYDNEREARIGSQVTAGTIAAPAVFAAPFAGGASLSVVPKIARPNGSFYSVAFETTLPDALIGKGYNSHFKFGNTSLSETMASDTMSSLRISVPRSSRETILGESPKGWVWHHDVGRGKLQLVPSIQHRAGSSFWLTLHPQGRGGMSIWNYPDQ